jgi:RimJ/RimL family protein N-acetyltransferase
VQHSTPRLETRRLLLRPLKMLDAPQIQMVFPQWEIVQYLNNKIPWPYPANGAEIFCSEMALPAMERGEEWFWTIRLKSFPEELIGLINLRMNDDENRGFWMDPRHRRRGLMTEASEAVTDFWFDVLKFPTLRLSKAIENSASRRISEKQGMRVIATMERDYICGRLPAELWEITAGEWRPRKAKVQAVGTRNEKSIESVKIVTKFEEPSHDADYFATR